MNLNGIKQFAKNERVLENFIKTGWVYTGDIWIEFHVEKCAIRIIKSGKGQMTEGIELPNQLTPELSKKKKPTNT